MYVKGVLKDFDVRPLGVIPGYTRYVRQATAASDLSPQHGNGYIGIATNSGLGSSVGEVLGFVTHGSHCTGSKTIVTINFYVLSTVKEDD